MDKAFDAFSQGRNTGVKDRVTERRRVETYNDPNRYQMPPRRRLGIHAVNRDVTVTPNKSNITAFAEGLSEVQPKIMDYLKNEQVKENKKQIEYGKLDAMGKAAAEAGDTEYIDNEWRKFGYEQRMALMAGERISAELQVDVKNKDPMEDFDSWYEAWYAKKMEENPDLATMNPEHLESYNKPIQTGLTAAKNTSILEKDKEEDRIYTQSATAFTKTTIEEAIKNGYKLDNALMETIINDELKMNRWGRDKANDIIFNALSDIAIDRMDYSILDYFDEMRGPDGKIPKVSATRASDIEAIEAKIQQKIDKQTRDKNQADADKIAFKEANDKVAKEELNHIIGDPADMKGMDIPGQASPAETARQAQKDARDMYSSIKKALKKEGENGYAMTEEEAHVEALKRTINSELVQRNKSAAYTEAELRKGKQYRSSGDFYTELKEGLGDEKYNDYARKVYELDVQGGDVSTMIKEWNAESDGTPFLHPDHKRLILEEGKQASLSYRKKQKDEAKKVSDNVAKEVAAKVPQEDNTPTTVQTTPEEDKAFADMYKQSAEKAGQLDFDEADRPAYTEEYQVRQDDNQGLKPGGIEYISEDRPTQIESGSFGDSIFGSILGGAVDVFSDAFTFDREEFIRNPGEAPMATDYAEPYDYDYTTREADGSFSKKPKVWSAGDKKYVTYVPDVNTNPTIAEVKPSDVSDKNTFQGRLKMEESSGRYNVIGTQDGKEYMGAYQFGEARLKDYKDANDTSFTKDEFMNNPELQDEVFAWHTSDIREMIIDKKLHHVIGETWNGTTVTMDGLVAVAHLGGKTGLTEFVRTKGKYNPNDKHGTKLTKYLKQFSS